MSRAIADTSVFVAQEADRELGDLPDELAVSVLTAAELELGVLRATNAAIRQQRLATFVAVKRTYPLLDIDERTAACFAMLASEAMEAGRKLRRHDTWIAATALRHGVPVVTQDADFSIFRSVDVIRV
jgi:predicted nucleic acid-binding protein